MLKSILKESQVLSQLDLTLTQLDQLRRERNFPYILVTKTVRVYNEKDVEKWLLENKVNLGSAIPIALPNKSNQ